MEEGKKLIEGIFSSGGFDFAATALKVFQFQYENNQVYRRYIDTIGVETSEISSVDQIPFLPVRFFKTHGVTTGDFEPDLVFESSGTTATVNSQHFVKDVGIYEESFAAGFQAFYGDPSDFCVIGLLPSYLERENSSLVYMVNKLIQKSSNTGSGFYLNEFDKLAGVLEKLDAKRQKTLLIGVTFALLDFAEAYPIPLQNAIVMETGGMKGRRKEMVREEVHVQLKKAFDLEHIHSEYGMTELLSQAYSSGDGIFKAPPWMKILLRDEEDPLTTKRNAGFSDSRGVINVIDLANIYSCSFIATDDLGILHPDGSFEVVGRMDNSDLRGCSLLVV